MEYTAWPDVRSDLASTRQGAAVFLDNLDGIYGSASRQNWIARWTNIGDAQYLLGDRRMKEWVFEEASEAWLSALTAFEVTRRLLDQDDSQSEHVSAKIAAGIQRFALSSERKVERVRIGCSGQPEVLAYYLRAASRDSSAPAVICVSREEESGATLLGRLLPVAMRRGISILVVSHEDVSNDWRGQAEMLFSYCLDYLSVRPDVDQTRIGVYGEGLSAVLATDFATSDRRVAAAVCDGGLWNWSRTLASGGWMAGAAVQISEDAMSAHRARFIRQLRCPVLVIAGGHSPVSVSEAIKLQADCTAACIDLELTMPRMTRTVAGQIENFVASDDCIFGWLQHKLSHSLAP